MELETTSAVIHCAVIGAFVSPPARRDDLLASANRAGAAPRFFTALEGIPEDWRFQNECDRWKSPPGLRIQQFGRNREHNIPKSTLTSE